MTLEQLNEKISLINVADYQLMQRLWNRFKWDNDKSSLIVLKDMLQKEEMSIDEWIDWMEGV